MGRTEMRTAAGGPVPPRAKRGVELTLRYVIDGQSQVRRGGVGETGAFASFVWVASCANPPGQFLLEGGIANRARAIVMVVDRVWIASPETVVSCISHAPPVTADCSSAVITSERVLVHGS